MKTFKLVDTWGQVMLIPACIIFSLFKLDASFIYGYFVVGGWQVISALTHLVKGWKQSGARRHYNKFLLFAGVVGGLCLFSYILLGIYLMVLLFISPVIATWYCFFCYRELHEPVVTFEIHE